MRKKRIMHILYCSNFGGAERVVLNIIKWMSFKYEMSFVASEGPFEEVLIREGIEYILLKEFSVKNIQKVVKEWKPDMIHAHDFRASVYSSLCGLNIPIISHLHTSNNWMKRPSLNILIYLIIYPLIKRIVTVSDNLIEEMFLSKIFKRKLVTINNIVDLEEVNNKSESYQVRGKYDLAYIGRLSPEKNPVRFIEIILKIKTINKDIKAVMIGNGPLWSECENKISNLGLKETITMLGYLENPFPTLKKSKVLAITSSHEAFPLVAVEALSLNKPVFSTPVGEIKQIIDETCGGICHSDEEYVNKIMKIISDEEYYFKVSQKSGFKAKLLSNKEKYIQKLSELYEGRKIT